MSVKLGRYEYLTAANVIDHLNTKLGYVDYEYWSPNELSNIMQRVPDPTGKDQISVTIEVIREMVRRDGASAWGDTDPDDTGYTGSAIRNYAIGRWQIVDFAEIELT